MADRVPWHNYGSPTIGNRSDIENVPIERLAAFYHKYYQPDNAVLMVAGKFDEREDAGLVAESFGAIPRPRASWNDLHRRAGAGWRARGDAAPRRRHPVDDGVTTFRRRRIRTRPR